MLLTAVDGRSAPLLFEDALNDLFDALEWVDVTPEIADRAGELSLKYGRSNQGILMGDYLIAATALIHDLELWTRNVKHYPAIEGLEPVY